MERGETKLTDIENSRRRPFCLIIQLSFLIQFSRKRNKNGNSTSAAIELKSIIQVQLSIVERAAAD